MDGLLRRSPWLVFHWRDRQLYIHNYRTRVYLAAKPVVLELLSFFDPPRRAADLPPLMPDLPADSVLQAVEDLVAYTLLEPFNAAARARDRAMRQWDAWGLEARYFHWATKDVNYIQPEELAAYDEERKSQSRSPAAFKRYARAETISLPPADSDLPQKFTDVLYARRTVRHFDGRPITIEQLATLLKLTWGVSKWVDSPTFGKIGFKTSPSGGARHPIEAYVAVHNVRGLKQGLYHYAADRHKLHVIHYGSVKQRAEKYCGNQWWTRDAAALFIMTAVFQRTRWLYDSSRALRNIYIEAGHLCQTFYLTATALKLAPFCTTALADSMIERDLGLDGIRESVLYLAAAGHVGGTQAQ